MQVRYYNCTVINNVNYLINVEHPNIYVTDQLYHMTAISALGMNKRVLTYIYVYFLT